MKSIFRLIIIFVFFIGAKAFGVEPNFENILAKPANSSSAVWVTNATISATISGTTSVCQNAASPQITFTGSGGTEPYTFTYSVNSGSSQTVKTSSGSSVTVSAPTNSTGTFVYTLIRVTDGINTTDIVSGTATILVNPPPTVDFSFNNNNTCSGTVIQFTSMVAGAGPLTFKWDFGDSQSSTDMNPVHVFNSVGCGTTSFNVSLTITDANGCTNTKSYPVAVLQKPDIDFVDKNTPLDPYAFSNCSTASATNTIYTITVNNNSASKGCISTYSVDWGDGKTETNISFPITHSYTVLGSFNMTFTAVGAAGCINTKSYLVKNVSNPKGGIISPGSTSNLCAPTSPLQFAISGWGSNSPGVTYTVNYGDGTPNLVLTQEQLVASSYYNSTNPDASANYPVPHIYTTSPCPSSQFTVKLTISNACGSTPASVSSIIVYTKPVADFTVNAVSCSNTSVLFTNTTTTGYSSGCSQNAVYTWDFGDGTSIVTTPLQSKQNISHTYIQPGNFTVVMTAENLCGKTSATKQICIEPPLVPQFSLSTTSGCAPLSVITTNTTDTSKICKSPTFLWTITYTAGNCGTTSSYTISSGSLNSVNPSFLFKNPGSYAVKLSATNSCGTSISAAQTISVTQPPTVAINAIADLCGPGNISPTATVSSCTPTGTPTYAWSFPGGTPSSSTSAVPGTITYSATGNYTVSLTVTNECGASAIAVKSFAINEVPVLTNSTLAQTICSGVPTDSIPLKASVAGTTYTWTATATAGISGYIASGTTKTIPIQTITNTGLTSGTVTYTIVPKAGNCVGNAVNYVITVNPAPKITSQPVSNTLCKDGIITPLRIVVSTPGGTPQYQWYSNTVNSNKGGTLLTGETNDSIKPPTSVAGTTYYYCFVTLSSGGCNSLVSNTASITVNELPAITTQPKSVQTICAGGTVPTALSVVISGGAGINYQWYSNTTNSTVGGTKISSGGTSPAFTPPAFSTVGTYFYYVEISFTGSGCGNTLISSVAEIDVVADPVVVSQPVSSQTYCQNAASDSLKVTVSGGIGRFAYQWYKNTTNSTSGGTILPKDTLSYYVPSTSAVGTTYYYCVITQPNGPNCSVTSATAAVIVKLGPSISSQPQANTVLCKDVASPVLNISIISGVGTPTYQWYSNVANNTTSGTLITGETNSSFKPLTATAGIVYYYCVITLPTGGCSVLISNTAKVTVNPYPVIADSNPVICSGNAFTVSPSNSSGDVVPVGTTYTWTMPVISPAGSVTGAGAKTTPQTSISQTLINKTTNPATVTYTVIPLSGTCTGSSFQVKVTVNPSILATTTSTDISCFGANNGSIHTVISGGVPFNSGTPYILSWTGPNGYSSSNPDISGLQPGIYTLNVQDAGGCPVNKNDTILEPADILIHTDSTKNITCFGAGNGEIALTVTGGTKPYSFTWTKDGNSFPANTGHLMNLSPGNYFVSVSDNNTCGPKTASFTLTEPLRLVASLVNQTNNICFGDSLGAINVSVSGGTKIETSPGFFDYKYSWVGPNGFKNLSQNLTGLKAGKYTLTVTDKLGCTDNLVVTITEGSEIKINETTSSVTCYGADNGSITLNPGGGTPPYDIQWSNLGTGLSQSNLSAGDYRITVTDALNCQKIFHVLLPEPAVFKVNPVVKQISCFGANDGSIKLNFVGGKSPVKLVWSDNSTAGTERNNIGPGTYSVTITDGNSCAINRTFVINEPQQLVVSANIRNAFDCNKANSGAISLLVSGGTPPYSYNWSNGFKTQNPDSIRAGNYMVTVTDSVGCTQTMQYSVLRQKELTVKIDSVTDFNCITKAVKEVYTAHVSGGVVPYQLTWSSGKVSGVNNEVMETSQNGLVILHVVDALGCSADYGFTTNIPTPGISYELQDCNNRIYQFNAVVPNEKSDFFTYVWDFGDGAISKIKSPLHTFATPGSYNVKLTIAGTTCTSTYSTNVIVEQLPVVTIFPQPKLCQNDSLTVHANGAYSYRWNDGTLADSLVLKQAGDYSVVGTSKAGCTNTLDFTASYYDTYNYVIQSDKSEIVVDLTAEQKEVQNTLHFWTEYIPTSQYYWDFGDGTSDYGADVFHTYNVTKDGFYDVKLMVFNPFGCLEKTSKRIWVTASVLPNSFSPNGDGKNDVFLKGWHIQIYNRNGILIYDGVDGWDGTFKNQPVSNDTYYYVLYYTTEKGTKTKSGYVTIIR